MFLSHPSINNYYKVRLQKYRLLLAFVWSMYPSMLEFLEARQLNLKKTTAARLTLIQVVWIIKIMIITIIVIITITISLWKLSDNFLPVQSSRFSVSLSLIKPTLIRNQFYFVGLTLLSGCRFHLWQHPVETIRLKLCIRANRSRWSPTDVFFLRFFFFIYLQNKKKRGKNGGEQGDR